MADISIQFFAIPDELKRWVAEWHSIGGITLVAMHCQPFSVMGVLADDIGETVDPTVTDRLCFFLGQSQLDVRSKLEFEQKNVGELVLDIGRLSDEGLRESWLACRTDDESALKMWRRVATDLRKKTTAGITAISRDNGTAAFYRSCRYSAGAKQLESAGIIVLPIQGPGGPLIRLGDVRREDGDAAQ